MKSFTGTPASISLNTFQPPLIIHFTICSAFFTVTWAGESFRQHSVGGCPFVGMHSICVGCLLGSALLWIGHWKAQAPWLQSDRCRLVGASLLTACRQKHKQQLQCTNTQSEMTARELWTHSTCVPQSTSLASDPASVCLHPISWVRCCEWKKTTLCRMTMFSQHVYINYCYNECLMFTLILFYKNTK